MELHRASPDLTPPPTAGKNTKANIIYNLHVRCCKDVSLFYQKKIGFYSLC